MTLGVHCRAVERRSRSPSFFLRGSSSRQLLAGAGEPRRQKTNGQLLCCERRRQRCCHSVLYAGRFKHTVRVSSAGGNETPPVLSTPAGYTDRQARRRPSLLGTQHRVDADCQRLDASCGGSACLVFTRGRRERRPRNRLLSKARIPIAERPATVAFPADRHRFEVDDLTSPTPPSCAP